MNPCPDTTVLVDAPLAEFVAEQLANALRHQERLVAERDREIGILRSMLAEISPVEDQLPEILDTIAARSWSPRVESYLHGPVIEAATRLYAARQFRDIAFNETDDTTGTGPVS